MAQLIPIATVRIVFRPSQVQTSVFEYFGALIGSARDLHDIETKGYFTPVVADTQVKDSDTGEAVVLDYTQTDPLELLPVEYPRYRANSEIIPDTVKVYLKDLKYIQMFSKSFSAQKCRWLPGTGGDFGDGGPTNGGQLVREDDAPPYELVDANFGINITTGANGKFSLSMAVVSGDSPKKIEPGTVKIKIANPTVAGAPLVLMDIPPVGSNPLAFNGASAGVVDGAITGQLYAYVDDSAPGNVWPGTIGVDPVTAPTITLNTLKIDYHRGLVSGEMDFSALPATPRLGQTGSSFKCYTLSVVYNNDVALKALKNVGSGDWVVLDKSAMTLTGFTPTNIMNADSFAGVWASHADFTMAKIQENVKASLSDYAYHVATPTYTKVVAFNELTSVFTLSNSTVHKTDMLSENMDYRCHGNVALVAVEADEYRRLLAGMLGQYEIEDTGTIDVKGKITIVPGSLIIDAMVRDNAGHAYNDDPADYTKLLPSMSDPNFITGALYIEYENELQSATILNQLLQFDFDNMQDPSRASYIGQYDPRNRLGFAAYMTYLITPGRTFYTIPITWDGGGLTRALTALTKNRTIMHIGLLNEDDTSIGTFDAWLKNEALPINSRFRFGYCAKIVETNVDKVLYTENAAGTLAFSPTGALSFSCTTGGWNYLTKDVAVGDTFEYKDSDDESSGFYTVSSFDNTHLYFEDLIAKTKLFGDSGNLITFTTDNLPKEGTIIGYVKVKSATGVISLANIAIGSTPANYDASIVVSGTPTVVARFARAGTPPVLTVTPQGTYTIVGRPWAVFYPADLTLTKHAVYRTLDASERVDMLATQQTSDTNNIIKIVGGTGIQYTHTFDGTAYTDVLGTWFLPVCAFALKIGFPPHQPLTFVELSGFGLGKVVSMNDYDMQSDLLRLAQNGYYTLFSDEGGSPYCLSDVTAAIKTKSELEGVLSKIAPVFQYGNDSWLIVRPYLGKYNVVADLINLVGLKLLSLKTKYVGTLYPLLGTLLANVGDPSIVAIPNGLAIEIPMSPQDPNREIQITLNVTDKQV